MALLTADVIETYYGLGTLKNGRLELVIWLDPDMGSSPTPTHKLIVYGVDLPVYGPMLVTTHRLVKIAESRFLKGLRARRTNPGWASRLTFDPSPEERGPWRGDLHGHWDVKRVKIRRASVWERLR